MHARRPVCPERSLRVCSHGTQRSSFAELADITAEFLEVAIHTILHSRAVYPQSAFEQRKCFGVPVFMCRHPEVAAGIASLVASIRPQIAVGAVEALAVVLLDAGGLPVEHYKIDIVKQPGNTGPATYTDVDTQLAAALTRMATVHGGTPHKHGGWTVLVRQHDVLAGHAAIPTGALSSAATGLGFPSSAAKVDLLGGRSPWLRADSPGDAAADHLLPGSQRDILQLKAVRAGVLCLDITHGHAGISS